MLLMDFVNMCKDFAMLILSAVSMAINTLFSMPLFGSITVGHILLAFMAFGIIFGFILRAIMDKFSNE